MTRGEILQVGAVVVSVALYTLTFTIDICKVSGKMTIKNYFIEDKVLCCFPATLSCEFCNPSPEELVHE